MDCIYESEIGVFGRCSHAGYYCTSQYKEICPLKKVLPKDGEMNIDEMIEFIRSNHHVRISHNLFDKHEYIYSAEDGFVYDEGGYLFEDWDDGSNANCGIRMRMHGSWKTGWFIKE